MPTSLPSLRQTTDIRQASLIEAALRLAAQRSPSGITTGDLAAAVGITQGAVFRHFPSKDAIWIAVIDWVAVNLMDEAKRKGLEVDARSLSRDLGIPAIPITARTGDGIHTLLGAVADVIEGTIEIKPLRINGTSEFQKAVNELVPMIEQVAPGIPNARWLAIRLLDGDARVQNALTSGELADIVSRQQRVDVQFSKKMSVEGRQ